MTLACVFGA